MPILNEKQKKFTLEYLIDNNGTQAAIRAGYGAKNARQQASDLLTKPYIQDEIKKYIGIMEIRTSINAERVRRELAKIAFSNIFDLIDEKGNVRSDVTREDLASISRYKVKHYISKGKVIIKYEVSMLDKLRALELLIKMMGYFDKGISREVSENTGIVLLPAIILETGAEINKIKMG